MTVLAISDLPIDPELLPWMVRSPFFDFNQDAPLPLLVLAAAILAMQYYGRN